MYLSVHWAGGMGYLSGGGCQTPVKILPWRNFVADGNNNLSPHRMIAHDDSINFMFVDTLPPAVSEFVPGCKYFQSTSSQKIPSCALTGVCPLKIERGGTLVPGWSVVLALMSLMSSIQAFTLSFGIIQKGQMTFMPPPDSSDIPDDRLEVPIPEDAPSSAQSALPRQPYISMTPAI